MTQRAHKRRAWLTRGFSLLELSVVLAIIGSVVAGGMVTLVAATNAKQYNLTISRMDAIHKALLDYTLSFGRLPCPSNLIDTPTNLYYGRAASGSSCFGGVPSATNQAANGAVEGAVPFMALKIPEEYIYDGWGRKFRYAINPSKTAAESFPPSSGRQCPEGGPLTVKDAVASNRTTQGVYLLLSHGKNGHGGYTRNGIIFNGDSVNADELTNCHCNSSGVAGSYTASYVQKLATTSSSTAPDGFDDIVSFRDAWQLQSPNVALQANNCKTVYVADTRNNRIQVFDQNGNFLSKWGGAGQFNFPTCMAADSGGNVYVVDQCNQRVQKFDNSGNWLKTFGTGTYGSADGQFNFSCSGYNWCGLAIDKTGKVYVSDLYNNRVQKFNSDGTFATKWGAVGTGNGQFQNLRGPVGIGIDSSGNVLVADSDNQRVQKFSSDGTYISQFAVNGINTPWASVAVDNTGNIIVAMQSYWMIDKYNSVGTYQSSFCNYGSGDGQCLEAPVFSMDTNGNFWVVDKTLRRVQELSSSGAFISKFGDSGTGDGQFDYPNGILVTGR